MTQRLPAWQCIGCGKIERPRPCVGVCEDRPTELVYAAEHDEALARLMVVVRQIAHTTPREGEYQRAWLALQARARSALEAIGEDEPAIR